MARVYSEMCMIMYNWSMSSVVARVWSDPQQDTLAVCSDADLQAGSQYELKLPARAGVQCLVSCLVSNYTKLVG
jgi:hypothetical protein